MATNRRRTPARVWGAPDANHPILPILGVVFSVLAAAFLAASCSTGSGPRDQNWGSDIGRSDGSVSTGGQGGGSNGGGDGQGGSTGTGSSGGSNGSTGGVGDGASAGAGTGGVGGAAGAVTASGGAGGGT